jgi:hypothetical protein
VADEHDDIEDGEYVGGGMSTNKDENNELRSFVFSNMRHDSKNISLIRSNISQS